MNEEMNKWVLQSTCDEAFFAMTQEEEDERCNRLAFKALNGIVDEEVLAAEKRFGNRYESLIDAMLIDLMRLSIDAQIKLLGKWVLRYDGGNDSGEFAEFEDEVIERYCLQITRFDMYQYGGDFVLTLEAVGELGKLFDEFGVCAEFVMHLANEHGGEMFWLDEKDIGTSLLARCEAVCDGMSFEEMALISLRLETFCSAVSAQN